MRLLGLDDRYTPYLEQEILVQHNKYDYAFFALNDQTDDW